MKGHLSDKDIIGYINGGVLKRAPGPDHIAACARCRKRYGEILSLVAPSADTPPGPGKRLEKRILATYRRHNPDSEAQTVLVALKRWSAANRPRAALAAAVVLAMIGTSLYFGVSYLAKRDVLPMYVYYYKGSSTIDDEKVRYHMPIRDRSEIRVGKGSVLVLACKRRFIVKLFSDSVMVLKKLPVTGGDHGHQFVFNLRKGTLYTKYTQNNLEKYFYFTPNASLATRKSAFIMKVAGNRTIVIPKEGAVNIRSFVEKGTITTSPEKEYVITSSIEISEPSGRPETRDLRINLERPFSDEEIHRLTAILDSII
jgi:hypothetical protein